MHANQENMSVNGECCKSFFKEISTLSVNGEDTADYSLRIFIYEAYDGLLPLRTHVFSVIYTQLTGQTM